MRYKLFILALGIFAVGFFSACKQGSNLTDTMPMKTSAGGGSTSAAHPALAFEGRTGQNGNYTYGIAVSDTDAKHWTMILTSNSYQAPCWSPGGGSICFLDEPSGVLSYSLKAADVSVNSSGVPVASNIRTIYAPLASDSVSLTYPRWSQNSSTGKIAFRRLHRSSAQNGLFELCTIPASGGSVTVIASFNISIQSLDWSPDDSKIAVTRSDSMIVIFDASNGTEADSIDLHGISERLLTNLRWSHSGSNELAFTGITSGKIYYISPSTGATASTNNVIQTLDCWSPNNSSLLLGSGDNPYCTLQKLTPFSTTASTIDSRFIGGSIDWKH